MTVETTSVRDLIRSRRTIFAFKPDPVPADLVEDLLEAAIWAPNHHFTEPWRFILVGEQTKRTLAASYRQIQLEKANAKDPAGAEECGEKGFQKLMSKPTIVVVSCVQDGDEQRRREDYAATCCAMQNVQLAAWETGVGVQWSTGALTRKAETYQLLDIDAETEYIIGFFYMGYAEKVPRTRRRPLDECLRRTA